MSRGSTRPMHGSDGGGADDHQGHGAPYSEGRRAMLRAHHRETLWVYWTLILLGFWLIAAPSSLGYLNESTWVQPSGGRGVWFGDDLHTRLRAWLTTWSDLVAGLLLVVFGWRALTPDRPVSIWACCLVGVWLSVAPLVFWAPTAAAYLNDTLVGLLVIALAILVPGMPNMVLYMRMGPPRPPGWSYNPSNWPQRGIMIALGFVGLLVSRYLAMYQLGYVDAAWDPFFGSSTAQVLDSAMSHAWPVSDAGLGALAYTFEFLMGWMGSPARWRTMPWMVAFFGILVIPLGLVHIFLVISQPVVVGEWCTFCLLAAAIMLPMIPLEVDEVIAMGQHLAAARRRGERLWDVFWKGGDPSGSRPPDEAAPDMADLPAHPGRVLGESVRGMSVPWALAAATILGVGLMAVPDLFAVDRPASIVYHLGGALVVVASVLAMGEPLRLARYLNLPLGLAVAALPWLLEGAPVEARLAGVLAGLALMALAPQRGPRTETYAGWTHFVR